MTDQRTADAIREVTSIMQQRIEARERSTQIDAHDVIDILLTIADRIAPETRQQAATTMYLVATLSRYVLVEAENEEQAGVLGKRMLEQLYRDDPPPGGHRFPIKVHTVRPATDSEIADWNWYEDKRHEFEDE